MNRWLTKIVALLAIVMAGRRWAAPADPAVEIAGPVVRSIVKHPWLTAGMLGGLAAVAALVGVISGIVPIKASSGHWAITAAFLDFAKVRSVSTHSLFIQAPPVLDTPDLVLRGAGHYQTGCYQCHGGPGTGIPPVMAAMTPPPPELAPRIARWKPEELFTIVKHGIKFTGMPAWPVQQRDDEVWAMVAFLRRLPALDAATYRTLVSGDAGAERARMSQGAEHGPSAARDICARCHGTDGHGRGSGAFPRLAGQSATYLLSALQAFARGDRHSGLMQPIAAGLSEPAMRELALHYSRLKTAVPIAAAVSVSGTAADPARGAEIARRGIPAQRVPACSDCHGPATAERNPAYPGLAGQHPDYLTLQLGLFARRERGGSEYSHLMLPVAGALTTEQIAAVASYYASLSGPLRP